MSTAPNTTMPVLAESCPLLTFNVEKFNNIIGKINSYSSSCEEENGSRDMYAKEVILNELKIVTESINKIKSAFSYIRNEGNNTTQHFIHSIPESSRQMMNEISKLWVVKEV